MPLAEIPGDLVPLGFVHNYGDCRDLLIQLIEVSYESGAIRLWWDSTSKPTPIPSTRTLLWVGGQNREEREYYCDVVTERDGRRPVLISKADLERLAAEVRAAHPIVMRLGLGSAAEPNFALADASAPRATTDETTEPTSIDKPAPVKTASSSDVKAAVEKQGRVPERDLLKAAKEELAPKHVSRQQVRNARDELFGKPGRIGRPRSTK